MSEMATILVIDHSPGDVRLLEEAFDDGKVANQLYAVSSATEARSFLRQEDEYADAPRPDLILLDIHLPDGGEKLLATLKAESECKQIPVIVLTSSDAEEDILRSYELNANAFVRKPVEPTDFIELVNAIEDFWLALVELPSRD